MIKRVITAGLALAFLALPAPVGAIIGGSTAADGSWPWEVQVVVNASSSCAGALVAPARIVTAAHCVSTGTTPVAPSAVLVLANDHRTLPGDGAYIQATAVTLDPGWTGDPAASPDLALVDLASAPPAPATPITLAGAGEEAEWGAGQQALVAGWGLTNPNTMSTPSSLQEVRVPVGTPTGIWMTIGDATHGACAGDAGAPVIVQDGTDTVTAGPTAANGQWRLAGVVSFGTQSCNDVSYAVAVGSGAARDFVAPAPTGGGGGGGGGGSTPPPGGTTTPPPDTTQPTGTGTPTPAVTQPLALRLKGVSRAARKLRLRLVAAEPISGLKLKLKRGGKTLATLSAGNLSGTKTVTMKLGRKLKLKKGRYKLVATGSVGGVPRTLTLTLKLK